VRAVLRAWAALAILAGALALPGIACGPFAGRDARAEGGQPRLIGTGEPGADGRNPDYPWIDGSFQGSVASRLRTPFGHSRLDVERGSFAEWLRGLPLEPGRGVITMYDGSRARTQRNHVAVVALDVGGSDLQQCADSIIRLRAEYLRVVGREDEIAFHFTSGDLARWTDWRDGMRPTVRGNSVTWSRSASPDGSYGSFRRYLDTVFTYAGTHSLEKELEAVENPALVEPGDLFIVGGFPGHAMLVLDVAENRDGRRMFMLAQGLLPARDFHVVHDGGFIKEYWHRARSSGRFYAGGWPFAYTDLRRFRD